MELILIAAATSADVFAAGMSIGVSKIKLPLWSAAAASAASAIVLCLSAALSSALGFIIPTEAASYISKALLLLIGVHTLIDSLREKCTSNSAVKAPAECKAARSSEQRIPSAVCLMSDGAAADRDGSRTISVAEALMLGFILSLDSIAMGIGAGLSGMSAWHIFAASIAGGFTAIMLGYILGRKIAARKRLPIPAGALGGALLILLALIM